MRASRLAAAPFALLLCSTALAEPDVFPRSGQLFAPMLAAPRETQLSVGYYRLKGQDSADVALGHSWGMARWNFGDGDRLNLQWDIDAMAFSRFKLDGSVNEFQTVDFFGALPFEARYGDASGRLALFHQSSHLGDDYIRRTGETGFRYSIDGLRGALAYDVFKWLRGYVDGTYLLHTVPAPQRGAFGFGAELRSLPLFHINTDLPVTYYLGWDLQSHAQVRWNIDSSVQTGLRLRFRDEARSMRLFWEYFDGHSPYGEFYFAREHYSELGLAFDF